MRLAWITDPHLGHVRSPLRARWHESIRDLSCDALLVTGDVGESVDVMRHLEEAASFLGVPIYFVLGNHDFYGSSIGRTVAKVIRACREDDRLRYLTDLSAIPIGEAADAVYLVGEDGWGDATEGSFEDSYVRLKDFVEIEEFQHADYREWKRMLNDLGKQSADRLAAKLKAVPLTASQILVATHVPPFRESCWYEGRTTDDNWAPFFVCGQVGSVLREFAQQREDTQLTVLCGHTHHGGVATMTPNLVVHTGGAVYGQPSIVGVIDTCQRPLEPRPSSELDS